jgi:hypothetical protein
VVKKKDEKPKEEIENVGDNNSNDNPASSGGTDGGTESSGSSGGGESSGGGSESSGGENSSGGSGSSSGGGSESGGRVKDPDRTNNLLQSIRAKRSNGLGVVSSNPNGASNGDSKGNASSIRGSDGGTKGNNGTNAGTNRTSRRGSKQDSDGDSLPNQIAQGTDSSGIKAAGINVKGVDKIKALAQQATAIEPPKVRFSWDSKPLTNKEGEEVLPKIRALLEFVFRHMDKGITVSNRNRAQAAIWSNIDGEDIDIIASHLVEMGKASKVVATAVRRMTNSYRLLQIGLITLPKFIQTYQFYAENGGFALGLKGGKQ